MSSHAAAPAEPSPTPAPGSGERPIEERRRIADLIARHADARSVDELPPELRENPIICDIVSMTPEEKARLHARIEAGRLAEALYGDDAAAELAALEAGRHPACRLGPAAR